MMLCSPGSASLAAQPGNILSFDQNAHDDVILPPSLPPVSDKSDKEQGQLAELSSWLPRAKATLPYLPCSYLGLVTNSS